MSSGNHASVAECDHDPEPRGPGVHFAGLCVACGRATTHRDQTGLPRHDTIEEAA